MGVDETRRLALKAGATEPLLKLRTRGKHDTAGAAATRVLEELSNIDITITMKLDDTVRQTIQLAMLDKHLATRHQHKRLRHESDGTEMFNPEAIQAHHQAYEAIKPAAVRESYDTNSKKSVSYNLGR